MFACLFYSNQFFTFRIVFATENTTAIDTDQGLISSATVFITTVPVTVTTVAAETETVIHIAAERDTEIIPPEIGETVAEKLDNGENKKLFI